MAKVNVEQLEGMLRMAGRVTHILVLLIISSIFSRVTSTGCREYRYCEGQLFSSYIKVDGKQVNCDNTVNPKDRCCLPQVPHLACYNITVNEEFLNFDTSSQSRSTDFAALCKLLLKAENRTTAPYTVISLAADGGKLAYRYDEWVRVDNGATHIKDIACQYGPDPTTTAPDTTTTQATTTEEMTSTAADTTEPASEPSTSSEPNPTVSTVNSASTDKTGGDVKVLPPSN